MSISPKTQRVIYGFWENHCVAFIFSMRGWQGREGVYEYSSKCDALALCRRSWIDFVWEWQPAPPPSIHLWTPELPSGNCKKNFQRNLTSIVQLASIRFFYANFFWNQEEYFINAQSHPCKKKNLSQAYVYKKYSMVPFTLWIPHRLIVAPS